jgi:Tfp pilus assembly protein PilZ
LLRGHVSGGIKFEARAVLSNMSASGMYLRTKRHIQPGENVFVVVRLSTAPFNQQGDSHRLAAAGTVVRIEPKVDGTYGVALQLHQHRFL